MTEEPEYKIKTSAPLSFTPEGLIGLTVTSVRRMPAEVAHNVTHYLLVRGLDENGRECRVMIPGTNAIKPCPKVILITNDVATNEPFFTIDEFRDRLRDKPLQEVCDG